MSSIVSLNAVNNSVSATAASTLSSSSNSNSPTGSLKTVASGSSSSNGGRRNRKILPIKYREYDPEKHCGVIVGNIKPCTRSLTCKTHQISLRRNVDGRSKPFDQLLAEHRNNVKDGLPKSSSSKQVSASVYMVYACGVPQNLNTKHLRIPFYFYCLVRTLIYKHIYNCAYAYVYVQRNAKMR